MIHFDQSPTRRGQAAEPRALRVAPSASGQAATGKEVPSFQEHWFVSELGPFHLVGLLSVTLRIAVQRQRIILNVSICLQVIKHRLNTAWQA